jgi:hypothetical protein
MAKRRRMIVIGAFTLALALLGLALALRPAQANSGLAEARQRWEAAGPDAYRLRLTQQTKAGACDQEMVTQDGRATAVRNSCGQPATWTVPRLFNWIAELEQDPTQCYPDTKMCACRGSTSTSVRYDEALGYPAEIVYEWRKQPNLGHPAYWRSLLDRSFPGCNRDGRGGPVVVSISLIEEAQP